MQNVSGGEKKEHLFLVVFTLCHIWYHSGVCTRGCHQVVIKILSDYSTVNIQLCVYLLKASFLNSKPDFRPEYLKAQKYINVLCWEKALDISSSWKNAGNISLVTGAKCKELHVILTLIVCLISKLPVTVAVPQMGVIHLFLCRFIFIFFHYIFHLYFISLYVTCECCQKPWWSDELLQPVCYVIMEFGKYYVSGQLRMPRLFIFVLTRQLIVTEYFPWVSFVLWLPFVQSGRVIQTNPAEDTPALLRVQH